MREPTTSTETVEWADVDPVFGSALPFGACNARMGDTVCGWPRRPDRTCMNPTEPHTPPAPTSEVHA